MAFFDVFSRFFAFQKALRKMLRKIIEKNAKIDYFCLPKPSQNRPKILPKSRSQKTCDFSSIFVRKMLCCKSSDIDFVLVFPIRNACRALFFKSLFACILGPKNLPKTVQNRGPNPSKIDSKNDAFFNIDFFTFWARFGRVLGSQVGAKLGQNGKKKLSRPPTGAFLR